MKLESKKNVGTRHVFDITVEHNHNFVVSGAVVHNCMNFRIVRYIEENLHSTRLLIQTPENREEILRFHETTSEPTILVSPSMTEGVDLKDELSRFQVFCKIPFPSMNDWSKKRMEKDPDWYSFCTVRTMVQAHGRSIRSETDWATSYILDECAGPFVRRSRRLFPRGFLAAIQGL